MDGLPAAGKRIGERLTGQFTLWAKGKRGHTQRLSAHPSDLKDRSAGVRAAASRRRVMRAAVHRVRDRRTTPASQTKMPAPAPYTRPTTSTPATDTAGRAARSPQSLRTAPGNRRPRHTPACKSPHRPPGTPGLRPPAHPSMPHPADETFQPLRHTALRPGPTAREPGPGTATRPRRPTPTPTPGAGPGHSRPDRTKSDLNCHLLGWPLPAHRPNSALDSNNDCRSGTVTPMIIRRFT